jgi:hypothetical protein
MKPWRIAVLKHGTVRSRCFLAYALIFSDYQVLVSSGPVIYDEKLEDDC